MNYRRFFNGLKRSWDDLISAKAQAVTPYPGASGGRLIDMITSSYSPNAALYTNAKTLRARAQSLERANEYVKKYLGDVRKNVLGAQGIRLDMALTKPRGALDTEANDLIETAWAEWGTKENCTTTGRQTWDTVCNLALRSLARDGEVLCRLLRGWANPFAFTLQPLEADLLDDDYNEPVLQGGRRIVMGVESDEWGKPLRYHVLKNHPGECYGLGTGVQRLPLSAADLLHVFIPERIGQTRGVSWLATPIVRLNNLAKYEEAHNVAARIAACKMAAVSNAAPEGWTGEDDGKGNLLEKVEPGSIWDLPTGCEVKALDWEFPQDNYRDFRKTNLQAVASGLECSYNTLANDYEAVNFSSIRASILDEREQWRMLQRFFTTEFLQPVFNAWLEYAIMAGQLPYSIADLPRLRAAAFWCPRGWDWVQPLDDIRANQEAVKSGFKSRRQVVKEQGRDIEDIDREQAADKASEEANGVEYGEKPPPTAEPSGVKPDAE